MRLLIIHAEEFEYEAREKAIDNAEKLDKNNKSGKYNNVLVCFTSIERSDEKGLHKICKKAASELRKVGKRVGVKEVVIYPYAHLSDNLASPNIALQLLKELENYAKEEELDVHRAPFGWYKSFSIKCIGHPLAEVSRTITLEETEVEELEEYLVLTPSGGEYGIQDLDLSTVHEDFRVLVEKEALKRERAGGEPRYIEYCKRFGIEWEPMSDTGHMRYGPEATMMLELVGEYSWICAQELGIPVLKVKGTNMFDLSYKPVKQHAELYGDRLYTVEVEDKRFVLRYAACHQQFAMIKDWNISHRHLPFGAYELADSYRLEQSGELSLCFRMRKFYMPDLHIFCRDLDEAIMISYKVHKKIYEEIRKIGRDYVSIYNTTRSFYENHKNYFIKLAEMENKPVLIHFVPEGKYYWVINVEYNIIDDLNRPREIGTFQIDVGNARRFGITYTDERGEKRHPVIIHTAIIGSVERYLYAIFDTAVKKEKITGKASLPTWLSPVQVRIVPLTKEELSYAIKLANEIESKGFRVDIDDREESVAKRIRDAEVKWIPYIVVIGRDEVRRNVLSVRVRGEGVKEVRLNELIEELERETKGYPKLGLSIPRLITQRPGYR